MQVHALSSSEAQLQEGRYWLLLPLGNTGDRLKSRGKKVISPLVCPEQEKVPDTNKLINAESSWGQAFPSPPLFFWFFSNWLGLDSSGESINIKSFLAFPWSTPRTIWIPPRDKLKLNKTKATCEKQVVQLIFKCWPFCKSVPRSLSLLNRNWERQLSLLGALPLDSVFCVETYGQEC